MILFSFLLQLSNSTLKTYTVGKSTGLKLELNDRTCVFINNQRLTKDDLEINYLPSDQSSYKKILISEKTHYQFDGGILSFKAKKEAVQIPLWIIRQGLCSKNNFALIGEPTIKINSTGLAQTCIFTPPNIKSSYFVVTLSNPEEISNYIVITSDGEAALLKYNSHTYQPNEPFVLIGLSSSSPVGTFTYTFSALPKETNHSCDVEKILPAVGEDNSEIPNFQCIFFEKPGFLLWVANLILYSLFLIIMFILIKKKIIDVSEFCKSGSSLSPSLRVPPSSNDHLEINNIDPNELIGDNSPTSL